MDSKQTIQMTFKDLVRATLPVGTYESLFDVLNCTKNRVTKILDAPEEMNWEELSTMSSLLDLNPSMLIEDFDCGIDAITIKQYRELLKHDRSL